MNKINVDFFKVPKRVFDHKLSGSEYLILNYLLSFQTQKSIYPSKKTIAKEVNLSPRTVDRVINSLVFKGFITYKKGKRNISNQYKIVMKALDPKCTRLTQISMDNQNKCDEIIRQFLEEYGS